MGKTTFDMVEDVRGLLNVSTVTSLLNGGLVEPELKSTPQDVKGIVIGALGITGSQIQVGNGNVNIHAPMIESKVNGKPIFLPDQEFFSNLTKVIKSLLDGITAPTFKLEITSCSGIIQDADGSYFANLRYRYTSTQKRYKKI